MDVIQDPANHPFTPSKENIIFPQNQPVDLVSGRPVACSASERRSRNQTVRNVHDRRRPIFRPQLEAWFEAHRGDHYPTKEVVSFLAAKENLSFKQVKGWLGRRRKQLADASTWSNSMPSSDMNLIPNSYHSSDTRAQALSDRGISQNLRGKHTTGLEDRETASCIVEKLKPCPSTSPIELYKMTPPREESSPVQTSLSAQNQTGPPRFTKRSARKSTVGNIDCGTGTAPGPVISITTASSLHSSRGFSITISENTMLPHRQKGKRVAPQKQHAPERQGQKIFQCTRCNIGYRYFSDWARHLEIHEPQQHYTCMLQGETVIIGDKVACPFCNLSNPTQDHLITHNVNRCAGQTHKKRTFQRRDHMLSHMKRVHDSSVQNPPDAWMTVVHEVPNQQFWCGFCRSFLRTTWDSRLQHLCSHFKDDDFDMTKWIQEGIYPSSIPDDFAHSIGLTHSMDPAHVMGSIHLTGAVPSLDSTPPMSFVSPTSPADTNPARHTSLAPPTSPAPPTSSGCFMEIGSPLDSYYSTDFYRYIDPAILNHRPSPREDPPPDQSAFSDTLDLVLESLYD